jgi:hypothetical protein
MRTINRLWILFILPIVISIIGIFYIENSGWFFLRSVDPEYGYLFSGMLMAELKFNISYIDHPGTPVQCIAALVIRLVHLFRPGNTLVDDVLLHSEIYIRSVLIMLSILNALAVWFLGYYTYRYSRNIILAVFLQLTPFSHVLTLEVLGRLMPEPLMNILVCGWLILIIGLIFRKVEETNYRRYSLGFAMVFGLSLANKLTFLPFFIIPLLVLPAWRHRIRYFVFSVFFFLLFAFPVTIRLKTFFEWVNRILLHTGSYGSGERGLFKWYEFLDHLQLLAGNTRVLLWTGLSLMAVAIAFVMMKRKSKNQYDIKIRTGFALILVVVFEYFMAAKHFSYHYMVPAILLTVFMVSVALMLTGELFPRYNRPGLTKGILVAAGLLMLSSTFPKVILQLGQIQQHAEMKTAAFHRLEPLLESVPKIICPDYYGCPAVEYALTFGTHLSGRYGNYLTKRINALYPQTYMYFPWGKTFYQGNRMVSPDEIIRKDQHYTVYMANFSNDFLKEFLQSLQIEEESYIFSIQQLCLDTVTSESVMELSIEKPPSKKIK